MKFVILLTFLSLVLSSALAGSFSIYTIQEEDSISEVMARYKFKDLYNKKRWVNKVLELNHLTEESARKLKKGDIIVLPVLKNSLYKAPNTFISKSELTTIKKSWKLEVDNSWQKPKKHLITFIAGFGFDDYDYGVKNSNVRVNQVFTASLRYKRNKIESSNRLRGNFNTEISVYTQSNASFTSDKSKIAEFTPSLNILVGWELQDRKYNLSINPILQNEYFSTLTFDNTNYNVRKINLTWTGLELRKDFVKGRWSTYLAVNAFVAGQYNANKYGIKTGVQFKKRYLLEAFSDVRKITVDNNAEVARSGINFGYQF